LEGVGIDLGEGGSAVSRRAGLVVWVAGLVGVMLGGCRDAGEEGPCEQMVLRHVLPGRIDGLDPTVTRDLYSHIVSSQIFETLYQYHYLKRPYELVPLLAEGMPRIGEDGLEWEVRIKRGVRFQDDGCFAGGRGRLLEAEDYVFALKRIADIRSLSPNWSVLEGRLEGLDEFRQYTIRCAEAGVAVDYSRAVEGVFARDARTVVFRLKRPWPGFLWQVLANPGFVPIAREAVECYGDEIVHHPVGTGPYRLSRWRRGSFIELVRNEWFRGERYPSEGEAGDVEAGYLDDAGKLMPFADRIVWTVVEESQPRWLLFLQGRTGAVVVPKESFDTVLAGGGRLAAEFERLGIRLQRLEEPRTYFLGFNMADAVVGSSRLLRRAISYAIDREKLNELFFGGSGLVADGLIPPMLPSYNQRIRQMGYGAYRPERARALLERAREECGGKIGRLRTCFPGTGLWYRQYGGVVRRSLEAVGLEVESEYMDRAAFAEAVGAGRAQIFAWSCRAGGPDAGELLREFYGAGAGGNRFGYHNAEFDRLFERAVVLPDGPERRELYQRLESILLEDCVAVFLNHRAALVVHHGWYKNYKPHAFGFGLDKYVRVDRAERARYLEAVRERR